MAILPIVTFPNPILKEKSKPVTLGEIEKLSLIENMIETATQNNLVGLAAVQVGFLYRVFIVNLIASETDGNGLGRAFYPFINPEMEIIETKFPRTIMLEGCASLNNFSTMIERDYAVNLSHLNKDGHFESIILKGYPARIAQHEMAHLNGSLIIDEWS